MSASNDNNLAASANGSDAKRVTFKKTADEEINSVDVLTTTSSPAAAAAIHKAAEKRSRLNSISMRRSESYGHMTPGSEAHVLVIYTGGTIGMVRNENNG